MLGLWPLAEPHLCHIVRKRLCHMRKTKAQISLSSTIILHCLDSISILAKSKISRLYLVSADEQTGLSLTGSKTQKDRFSHDVAQLSHTFRVTVQTVDTLNCFIN